MRLRRPDGRGVGALRGIGRRIAALPAWFVVAAGVLALAGGLFAGFVIGKRQLPGAGIPDRLDRAAVSALRGPQPGAEPSTVVAPGLRRTALIGLELAVASFRQPGLPPILPPQANGGGLAVFGGDVLVLAFDGWIHAASGPDDLHRTGIRAPGNGRAEYAALAGDPTFAGYRIDPDMLRYNDLLAIEGPAGPALLASCTEFHADRACYTNTLARFDLPPGAADIAAVPAGSGGWTVAFRTEPCRPLKTRWNALEGLVAGGGWPSRRPRRSG